MRLRVTMRVPQRIFGNLAHSSRWDHAPSLTTNPNAPETNQSILDRSGSRTVHTDRNRIGLCVCGRWSTTCSPLDKQRRTQCAEFVKIQSRRPLGTAHINDSTRPPSHWQRFGITSIQINGKCRLARPPSRQHPSQHTTKAGAWRDHQI